MSSNSVTRPTVREVPGLGTFKIQIKGTVRILSSDPPCKDQFTRIPLKAFSGQV